MTSQRHRAPRRDALANRERILAAAEHMFDTEGIDASLHALAESLELGIGTLYRHFATREVLVRAVYDRQARRTGAVFERCAGIDDGWEAMVTCIDGVVQLLLDHPSMPAVAVRMAQIDPDHGPARDWHPIALAIVQRGHAQGSIRADVTAMDVAHLPSLLAPLGALPQPARGMVIARMRGVLLDGLRPDGVPNVELPSLPLTPADLHALGHGLTPPDTVGGGAPA